MNPVPGVSDPIQPSTVEELAEVVRVSPQVIAVGAGTKPRLSQVGTGFVRVSTAKLRGIVEYEPSEFTFTARAGTPVSEIADVLARSGQYLPFDPMWADAGATLGGTVAAGLSGPGRFRFGGVRDFILGVRFVDGEGRCLRLGGRVVKNAAGFDLPKFLVGSAGRLGVLAEVTFKVFPRPAERRTLRIGIPDTASAVKVLTAAAAARWEIEALEFAPAEPAVYARLAGPGPALDGLQAEILARWPGRALAEADAAAWWRDVNHFRWAHDDGTLVKVVLTPSRVAEFVASLGHSPAARGWVGAGGNVGYLSWPRGATVPSLAWPAVTLCGDAPCWPGPGRVTDIAVRVKAVLDPKNRFPSL